MNQNMKKATMAFLAFLMLVGIVYAISVGQIRFPYIIQPKATMAPTPLNLNLETIAPSSSLTVASADSGSDLTVNVATNIIATLSGHTDFTAFSVTIELKQASILKYSATVTEATTSAIMNSVAIGTYDIWVGYSYTAGTTGSGTVLVDLTY